MLSKRELRELIRELEGLRGRHTELVSVYVPAGFNLGEIISMLRQEYSLTQNVKDKTVRKNVLDALEKIMNRLKLFKETPANGIAVFCGNVSKTPGQPDIKIWSVEPPEKLDKRLYWCDQRFELGPLSELVKEREIYGFLVLDKNEADLGILRGKKIEPIKHIESIVPGKSRAGGQSAARFARVREGLLHDFLKEVAEVAKKAFGPEVKGIIIGGPGPIKDMFIREEFLPSELREKIMGVKDTGYTGESGLEELLNRSQDILSEARVVKEKSICLRFLEALRTSSRMVTYGWDDVIKMLKLGAVETVLLSEDLGKRVEIEKMAKETNTKVEIISRHTREGEQIWQLGGIAAILRYPVEE